MQKPQGGGNSLKLGVGTKFEREVWEEGREFFILHFSLSFILSVALLFGVNSAWAAADSHWNTSKVGGSEDSPYDIWVTENWDGAVGSGNQLHFAVSEKTYIESTSNTQVGNDFDVDSGDFVFIGPLYFLCYKSSQANATSSVVKKGDWTIGEWGFRLGSGSGTTVTFTNESGNVSITGERRDDSILSVASGENSTVTVVKEAGDWSVSKTFFIGNGAGSNGRFYNRGGNVSGMARYGVCLGSGAGTARDAYLEISGGRITNTGGSLCLGDGNNPGTSTVYVTGNGEYIAQAGSVFVGSRGASTLTIDQNGLVKASANGVQFCAETACVAGRDCFLNLNGGTLETKTVTYGSGSAAATFTFNGGTLKALQTGTLIAAHNNLTVAVGAGGGVVDNGGYDVTIAEDIGGTGGLTFTGAGTTTLSGANTYSGGTTVELGTTLATADETAKNTMLASLVIDGRAKLNPTDYTVFTYSAGGLTDADLANVSFTNCATGTTYKIVDGNKIVVTLAAATCVPKTTNTLKVFEGVTLADIEFAEFSSRMCGGYVNEQFHAVDAAEGYNKKSYYEGGKLSRIIVEFQVRDGSNTKCVVVEFRDDGSDVYATGLGAKYSSDAIGKVFYEYDGTWHGTDPNRNPENCYAETVNAPGYGVCDIRWTPGEKPAWTLDADKNWSDFEGYDSLDPDKTVSIYATGNYTLTMDVDATVAGIAITGVGGATLSVDSGKTLTVGDISGFGNILNNGTLVKTGDGIAAWPFNNASAGTTIISNGTLKVASKAGTAAGTDHTVHVNMGATFDANGVVDVNTKVILEEGAHFVNNKGGYINYNNGQTVSITLKGDATVTATGNFGLIGPGYNATTLDLGANTLTLDGSGKFWLCNTTINGTGVIAVNAGALDFANGRASTGNDCTISIGAGGTISMYADLTVKNFENGGSCIGTKKLTVKGMLTPGSAAIANLTLADCAKVKATGTAQVVSTTFSASGKITVDASEIDAQTLKAAGETGIPVLTVPTMKVPSGVFGEVSSAPIDGTRAKWVKDKVGTTSTLYLCKPTGLIVIIR